MINQSQNLRNSKFSNPNNLITSNINPNIRQSLADICHDNVKEEQHNVNVHSALDRFNSSFWGTAFNLSSICGFGP